MENVVDIAHDDYSTDVKGTQNESEDGCHNDAQACDYAVDSVLDRDRLLDVDVGDDDDMSVSNDLDDENDPQRSREEGMNPSPAKRQKGKPIEILPPRGVRVVCVAHCVCAHVHLSHTRHRAATCVT
jgi:hypothetical protein